MICSEDRAQPQSTGVCKCGGETFEPGCECKRILRSLTKVHAAKQLDGHADDRDYEDLSCHKLVDEEREDHLRKDEYAYSRDGEHCPAQDEGV